MRTYQHAKSTDYLGRYYTQSLISRFLVEHLPAEQPGAVLDLGAGEGALTIAASSKWSDAALITVDVDVEALSVLTHRLKCGGFKGHHHHFPQDALGVGLQSALTRHNCALPGVAVCNPPFLVHEWRKEYSEIIEDAGFSGSLPAITSTDAAVLFLAQNLRLIADGGNVGIIVPDSLACADKYLRFRASLLERYQILHAIRLRRGSFAGTDALAHILILSKRLPTSEFVHLSCLPSKGGLTHTIDVQRDRAIHRLDYAYHASEMTGSDGLTKLGDVVIDLRRGTLNSAEVRSAGSFVLHTTDITTEMRGKWTDFSRRFYKPSNGSLSTTIAEPGDMILARVGRNAAGKVIGISKGHVMFSDCLYRLRILPEYRERVLRCLASKTGERWLEMHAYGVAARHISKSDLLNFPLDYSP
jgi:type I restriction enzyme M protein